MAATQHLPAVRSLEPALRNGSTQRVSELHLQPDADWATLSLMPRLPAFRTAHPNIRFCINGQGDVPVRLGAPDLGILLFQDVQVAVTGLDNMRRLGDWDRQFEREGLSLLHIDTEPGKTRLPGWPDWIERYGCRREGVGRGVHDRNLRLALEAVRGDVWFLIRNLALAGKDLGAGSVVLAYPANRHLPDVPPFRLFLRNETRASAQVCRFAEWLTAQAAETGARIGQKSAGTAMPQGAANPAAGHAPGRPATDLSPAGTRNRVRVFTPRHSVRSHLRRPVSRAGFMSVKLLARILIRFDKQGPKPVPLHPGDARHHPAATGTGAGCRKARHPG